MQKKIFRAALALTLLTALLTGLLSAWVSYALSEQQLRTQLVQELGTLSAVYQNTTDEKSFTQTLSAVGANNRLTWISKDGTVLYDNQSSPEGMENHISRQEIVDASQNETGYAKRYSQTLLEEQLYMAVKLHDGSYMRVAATQRTLAGQLWRMVGVLLIGIAVIVALLGVLSRAWTRRLVRPINDIDMENPLQNRVYDELSPMLRRMAEQNRRLDEQLKQLSDQRNELDAIIGHMNEGLLILDAHRHVLMMNESARAILHTNKPVDGHTTLLVYNRDSVLLNAVDTAIAQGSAHADMHTAGRDYLLSASVVRHREGLVLLMQDVTEQNRAEQARKRFTANVSHELRTPLTTISGYAELIQSGMTQPQDVPLFARKIYNESRRLIKLVEDILHLSKLDEGFAAGKTERLDLLEAAKTAADENAETASERDVTVTVTGESAPVLGDPTLLDEMIRNVIENGIKYNRAGGEVRVRVEAIDDRAVLTVTDTGIGIPMEHQEKVFERFYRVDGSRSKQTGGTGLGLSIVKHGAQFHHAEVLLTSTPDVGTTVELRFPLNGEQATEN